MNKVLIRSFVLFAITFGICACVASPISPDGTTQIVSDTANPAQTSTPASSPTAILTATSTPLPFPPMEGRLVIFERGLLTSICGLDDYDFSEEIGQLAILQEDDMGIIQRTNIAPDAVTMPVISPDGRYLLYVVPCLPSMIQSIDLQSLQITTVMTFPYENAEWDLNNYPTCLSWSPDGNQFSYIFENTLYVHNLKTNEDFPVYSAPSAKYERFNILFGDLQCADWVGNDHLFFQRFAGEMPYFVSSPDFSQLDTNSSTLAFLSPTVQLVDSPERLYIVAKAKDLSAFVIRREDTEGGNTYFWTMPFESLEEIEMAAKPIEFTTPQNKFHFLFSTQGPRLVVYKQGTGINQNTLVYFDSEIQLGKEYSFPESWSFPWVEWWGRYIQGRDSEFGENASLPFSLSPTNPLLIIFQSDECAERTDPQICEFRIGDLESGVYQSLWQGAQDHIDSIAWLP